MFDYLVIVSFITYLSSPTEMSGLFESEEVHIHYVPKLYLCSGHQKAIHCVAFNEEGSLLASGGSDNHLLIWSCRTGMLLHNIETHAAVIALVWISSSVLVGGLQDSLFISVRITEVYLCPQIVYRSQ